MSAERWARLAADLTAAGLEVTVSERAFAEDRRGRVYRGVSRSVTILLPDRGLVQIRDAQWRKNPDVWIGWTVERDDADGISIRSWRPSKRRSEVVEAVLEAVAR